MPEGTNDEWHVANALSYPSHTSHEFDIRYVGLQTDGFVGQDFWDKATHRKYTGLYFSSHNNQIIAESNYVDPDYINYSFKPLHEIPEGHTLVGMKCNYNDQSKQTVPTVTAYNYIEQLGYVYANKTTGQISGEVVPEVYASFSIESYRELVE